MNSRPCPVCGSDSFSSKGGGFYLCSSCCVMINSGYRKLDYSDSYFTADYAAQYGKTYFEDFENIYRAGIKRVERIYKHLQQKSNQSGKAQGSELSILDIGSAAGFFLKCAYDSGFSVLEGIEISSFAAEYSRENFNFPVRVSPFSETDINGEYDVISAWYFIEHSDKPVRDLRKIFASLRPGGVFAFSAPSIFGPLYHCNRSRWISTHPVDHLIDVTPASAKRLLKKIGFSSVKVYPAGIHPERMMSPGNPLFFIFSKIYSFFSRITSFSDTIEIYSVK